MEESPTATTTTTRTTTSLNVVNCLVILGSNDANDNQEITWTEFQAAIPDLESYRNNEACSSTSNEENNDIIDWSQVYLELGCLCPNNDDNCCNVIYRPGVYDSSYTYAICQYLADTLSLSCNSDTSTEPPTSAPAVSLDIVDDGPTTMPTPGTTFATKSPTIIRPTASPAPTTTITNTLPPTSAPAVGMSTVVPEPHNNTKDQEDPGTTIFDDDTRGVNNFDENDRNNNNNNRTTNVQIAVSVIVAMLVFCAIVGIWMERRKERDQQTSSSNVQEDPVDSNDNENSDNNLSVKTNTTDSCAPKEAAATATTTYYYADADAAIADIIEEEGLQEEEKREIDDEEETEIEY